MMRSRIILAALSLLALLGGAAAPAWASPSAPTLSVTPNPTTAFYPGALEATGCGYEPADWIDLYVTAPGAAVPAWVAAGPVDAAGCVDIASAGWPAGPGEYGVTAAHQVVTGQTVKERDVAATTVSVLA